MHEDSWDSRHISALDVTLEPGDDHQILSSQSVDGPVWKKIDETVIYVQKKRKFLVTGETGYMRR